MKLAIIDKNPDARFTQWRAAPNPKKFFHRDSTLVQDIKNYNPNVIFINKAASFTNIIKAIKNYKSAYFYGDWYQPIANYVKLHAKAADVVLFTNNDPAIRYELKMLGQKNVHFVSQGVDIELFKPLHVDKKYDIVFPGNYFGTKFCGSELRLNLVRHLIDSNYNVTVIGDGWPKDINALPRQGVIKLNKTLNQARVSVGISHFVDVPLYTSNRLYQCMATGTPHISWHSPKIKSLFKLGYLEVSSYKELDENLEELLASRAKRKFVGAVQVSEIKQRHTIFHAWNRIQKILERI